MANVPGWRNVNSMDSWKTSDLERRDSRLYPTPSQRHNLPSTSLAAGAAAESAASLKTNTHTHTHLFATNANETSGYFNKVGLEFITDHR